MIRPYLRHMKLNVRGLDVSKHVLRTVTGAKNPFRPEDEDRLSLEVNLVIVRNTDKFELKVSDCSPCVNFDFFFLSCVHKDNCFTDKCHSI